MHAETTLRIINISDIKSWCNIWYSSIKGWYDNMLNISNNFLTMDRLLFLRYLKGIVIKKCDVLASQGDNTLFSHSLCFVYRFEAKKILSRFVVLKKVFFICLYFFSPCCTLHHDFFHRIRFSALFCDIPTHLSFMFQGLVILESIK